MRKDVCCPVETTLRVLGGRWKVLVIHHLLDGAKRFGGLSRALRGISARTLTKQLRELEADGVVHRKVYQQVPPMVEYSLSPIGRTLEPVLLAMHDWGETYERLDRRKVRSVPEAEASPSPSREREGLKSSGSVG